MMQEPLVASPAQFFPRRHGEPVVTRQRLIIARNKGDRVVVGGKEHPSAETMFGRQVDEEVNLSAIVLRWPRYVAANVPRGGRHKMSTLLDDPNRNSTTTQTAHHTEPPIVRTHDQSTGGCGENPWAKIPGPWHPPQRGRPSHRSLGIALTPRL